MIVIGIAADIVRPARGEHEQRLIAVGWINPVQLPCPASLELRMLFENGDHLGRHLRIFLHQHIVGHGRGGHVPRAAPGGSALNQTDAHENENADGRKLLDKLHKTLEFSAPA